LSETVESQSAPLMQQKVEAHKYSKKRQFPGSEPLPAGRSRMTSHSCRFGQLNTLKLETWRYRNRMVAIVKKRKGLPSIAARLREAHMLPLSQGWAEEVQLWHTPCPQNPLISLMATGIEQVKTVASKKQVVTRHTAHCRLRNITLRAQPSQRRLKQLGIIAPS